MRTKHGFSAHNRIGARPSLVWLWQHTFHVCCRRDTAVLFRPLRIAKHELKLLSERQICAEPRHPP